MAPRRSVEALQVENGRDIRRVRTPSAEDVDKLYLSGEGEPVVVVGAQAGWFERGGPWTLEGLARDYGDEAVIVNDLAPLRDCDDPPMRTKRLNLRDYAAYARGEGVGELDGEAPWYMNSWEPFAKFGELRRDWQYPAFVEDLLTHDESQPINETLVNYTKVFIGVPGCTTRLHFDNLATHAWLAQVEGRKQFVLYGPADSENLRLHSWEERVRPSSYDCVQRQYDPGNPPDPAVYPGTVKLKPYVTTLEPGEIILVPRGWWHYARALDVNVTLMRNFANSSNSVQFKEALTRNDATAAACSPKVTAPYCVGCRSYVQTLKPCSSCKAVGYCSRKCQSSHWQKHRPHCALLKQLDHSNVTLPPRPEDLFSAPLTRLTFAKATTRSGTGQKPNEECMVRVHYEGFLADGQRMDSSKLREKPHDFHLSRSSNVKGWLEAIRSMQKGEKALIAVPPHAAYGVRGVPEKVPPNSALLFEVELLEIF